MPPCALDRSRGRPSRGGCSGRSSGRRGALELDDDGAVDDAQPCAQGWPPGAVRRRSARRSAACPSRSSRARSGAATNPPRCGRLEPQRHLVVGRKQHGRLARQRAVAAVGHAQRAPRRARCPSTPSRPRTRRRAPARAGPGRPPWPAPPSRWCRWTSASACRSGRSTTAALAQGARGRSSCRCPTASRARYRCRLPQAPRRAQPRRTCPGREGAFVGPCARRQYARYARSSALTRPGLQGRADAFTSGLARDLCAGRAGGHPPLVRSRRDRRLRAPELARAHAEDPQCRCPESLGSVEATIRRGEPLATQRRLGARRRLLRTVLPRARPPRWGAHGAPGGRRMRGLLCGPARSRWRSRRPG